MNALTKKMLVNWVLSAVGLFLLCVEVSWLFILGLALLFVSGLFSSHPRRWPWNLIGWLCSFAAVVFLAWFSSYGHRSFDWTMAAIIWVGIVATDLNWGAPRKIDGA